MGVGGSTTIQLICMERKVGQVSTVGLERCFVVKGRAADSCHIDLRFGQVLTQVLKLTRNKFEVI